MTGAALWRWRIDVVAGAVFSASVCVCVCVCVAGAAYGSCLKGLDVVERAARGLNLRDRRSAWNIDFVAGALLSPFGCLCERQLSKGTGSCRAKRFGDGA